MAICKLPLSPIPLCVIMMMYFLGMSLYDIGYINVIYNKLCVAEFNNFSLCVNSTFTKAHPKLQAQANVWQNYIYAVEIIPAILSNVALSSYCDKVGHKVPILIPLFGMMFSAVLFGIMSLKATANWPIYYILIQGFVYGMCGSYAMFIMSVFSYNAAITPVKKRAVVLAVTEASLGIGSLVANAINGPLLTAFGESGNTILFAISVGAVLVACAIIPFVKDLPKNGGNVLKWSEIFGFRPVLDSALCVFKRRPGHQRLLIHLSFTSFICVFLSLIAYLSCIFLYLVKEVGFSFDKYSIYTGYITGARSLIGPLILYILKTFVKIDGMHIAMIGMVTTIASLGCIAYGLEVLLWLGATLFSCQSLVFAILRSYQSQLVPANELGQLFAYEALLQITLSIVAAIFFRAFYIWTLPIWPGAFAAFGSLMSVVGLGFLVTLILVRASEARRTTLPTDIDDPPMFDN